MKDAIKKKRILSIINTSFPYITRQKARISDTLSTSIMFDEILDEDEDGFLNSKLAPDLAFIFARFITFLDSPVKGTK